MSRCSYLTKCSEIVAAAAILVSHAEAQSLRWKVSGGSANNHFGNSVAFAGDSSADGLGDVNVGEPGSDCSGNGFGRAVLLSGSDGSLLRDNCGGSASLFGWIVGGFIDVDGDSKSDYIVTASANDHVGIDEGAFFIYSGEDGSLLRDVYGTTDQENLGSAVVSLEDLDGDGIRDFAVGAAAATSSSSPDLVNVYSSQSGSVLLTLTAAGSLAFGAAVGDAGDVNGDGITDIIVGDYLGSGTSSRSGLAWVFSGTDGSVLHAFEGEGSDHDFGSAVDGLGDLDLDGCSDIIVGAPSYTPSTDTGKIYVYSGRTGTLLFTDTGAGGLGASVARAGDVNGDGHADYLASDTSLGTSCVRLYSGRDGSPLYHWEGPLLGSGTTAFGRAVAGGFDIDDDGKLEVLVGAPLDDVNGKKSGSVFLYSLEHFYTDLSVRQSYELGIVDVQMAQTSPGNLIGLALVGLDGSPLFSFLAFAPADSLGRFLVSGQIPTGTSGHDFDFQAFAIGFNGKVVASNIENLVIN